MLMENTARMLEFKNLLQSLNAISLVQRHAATLLTNIGRVWTDEDKRRHLVERALLTSPEHLEFSLAYAEKTKELKTVFDTLTVELGKEQYRDRLVERALLTWQGDIQTFLTYAEKTNELKTVFDTLTAELGKEQYRDRLVERALLTAPGDLQSFLAYAEKTKELKTVFDTLTAE